MRRSQTNQVVTIVDLPLLNNGLLFPYSPSQNLETELENSSRNSNDFLDTVIVNAFPEKIQRMHIFINELLKQIFFDQKAVWSF